MFTFVLVIHIIVSLLLMLVILLQDGKGGDIVSALGGGGSQTLFGSTGAGNFLTRATITLTVIFVLTSLGLAVLKTRESRSVLDRVETPTAAEQPAAIQGEPKPEGEAPAVVPEDAEDVPEGTVEEPAAEADSGTQTEETEADTPAPTEPESPGKNS